MLFWNYLDKIWKIYASQAGNSLKNILTFQGTHAQLFGSLSWFELQWAKELGTAWYRSKEPLPVDGFSGGGPVGNKKWPLNEESIYRKQCENIYYLLT